MQSRTAVLLIALAFALAACGGNGGDDPGAADGDAAANGGDGDTVEVDVTMVDIDFEPASASVPSGGSLVVNLTNDGAMEHDFQLEDGSGSEMLASGESETVELGPFSESTVAFCTVPGHREAGMEFEIDVE